MRKRIIDMWVENNQLWLTDETNQSFITSGILLPMTPIKNPPLLPVQPTPTETVPEADDV